MANLKIFPFRRMLDYPAVRFKDVIKNQYRIVIQDLNQPYYAAYPNAVASYAEDIDGIDWEDILTLEGLQGFLHHFGDELNAITKNRYAYLAIPNPTPEQKTLHDLIWEL